MNEEKNTLCKAERLNSKKAIEQLFSGNARSFSAFPLRIVFLSAENNETPDASILISVPKKRFKRAVKRNKVKRQIREGYRKNKHKLLRILQEREERLLISFIYLDHELRTSEEIEFKIKSLLERVIDKIENTE